MNRQQLKTLINEAIKEVLSEKTPKGFNPKLKKQITAKKKYIKEQEDDNASAEPDAGEVEGPTEPQGEHADLLSQIDNIQQTLADLRASVQGHAQGETPEDEESEEKAD